MTSFGTLEEQVRAELREREKDPRYHVNVFKVDFAEAVARQLEKTKISRAELAKRLGASRAYVTKMLNEILLAGPNLTMASMAKLAFALGVKIEPHFVSLAEAYAESGSAFSFPWSSPLDPKILERLSRCPSKPAEDYASEPVIKVIYVQEPFDQKSEREVGSEAFSHTG
jgi:transcriptional regulator with XRE-family HTH domain